MAKEVAEKKPLKQRLEELRAERMSFRYQDQLEAEEAQKPPSLTERLAAVRARVTARNENP